MQITSLSETLETYLRIRYKRTLACRRVNLHEHYCNLLFHEGYQFIPELIAAPNFQKLEYQ
eukprot:scaffold1505_cov118-Cylindrotheca_fusiformis.AAC.13